MNHSGGQSRISELPSMTKTGVEIDNYFIPSQGVEGGLQTVVFLAVFVACIAAAFALGAWLC